jgi:hypothetical protein
MDSARGSLRQERRVHVADARGQRRSARFWKVSVYVNGEAVPRGSGFVLDDGRELVDLGDGRLVHRESGEFFRALDD